MNSDPNENPDDFAAYRQALELNRQLKEVMADMKAPHSSILRVEPPAVSTVANNSSRNKPNFTFNSERLSDVRTGNQFLVDKLHKVILKMI